MLYNISYQLGEWQLREVNIFLSNIILGVVILICALKLTKMLPEHLERKHWDSFFWLLGISALLGAVGHLFTAYEWGEWLMLASWAFNILAIFKLERAVLEQIRDEAWRRWLIYFIYAKLIGFLIWQFIAQEYKVAGIHSAIGTIGLLLPVVVFIIRKKTEISVKWFVIGFLLSGLAGLAFALKWDLHDWVMHQDVGHYIVALSVICFYLAVRWLHNESVLYPARERWW